MELQVITHADGKPSSSMKVSEELFARPFNESLVHQIVTAYLAAGRSGTKAQKNRSDVRGGGKKPWRQKGNGRARVGSSRSPLWRGGGVTFAARTRNYAQKVNKKMYQAAMRSIFSELIRQDRLKIVDDFIISQPRTRELVTKLKDLSLNDVLILKNGEAKNLDLASRNIPSIQVCDVNDINPVVLINYEQVLMSVESFKKIEEKLS